MSKIDIESLLLDLLYKEKLMSEVKEDNNEKSARYQLTGGRYVFELTLILPNDESLDDPPPIEEIENHIIATFEAEGWQVLIKPIKQEFCYD